MVENSKSATKNPHSLKKGINSSRPVATAETNLSSNGTT